MGVQQNLLCCPKSSLALPQHLYLSIDILMEMGLSRERIAFPVSLARWDMQVCRIPRCQPSSNHDLVLQDSDFNITNMHRAHAVVSPFRHLGLMSDGNIIIRKTG